MNLLPIPETTEALLQVHDRLSEWLNGPVAIRREPLIGELRPDALLEADDITFIVEYSRKTDVVSLERAIHLLGAVEAEMDSSSHVVPLLVVPYLSKQARDLCEQNRIHCVDLSGNATIRARGKHSALIVEIAGKQNRYETRGRPGNTFAPKASRLPRFMLSNVRSSFRQITIAEETGLDPGYVSRLVKNLIAAGLLMRREDGTILVEAPVRLLEAWAAGNAYRHQQIQGHLPAPSGEARMQILTEALSHHQVSHAFTGLAGGWLYSRAASFRYVSCYVVDGFRLDHLEGIGFRTDTESPNVRLLIPDDEGLYDHSYIERISDLPVVSPLQVYVDLKHEPERSEEMAEALLNFIRNERL